MNQHTIDLLLAYSEDRLDRVNELCGKLYPLGWRVIWTHFEPMEASRLRCEGPPNDDAVERVRAFAEASVLLVDYA